LAGFYGGLSDRKGRRIVFMCGSFGNCILLLGYLATYYYEEYIGVFLLYLAPTIATCLGTETIFFAAAQAYLSDCTTPTKR
jgi:MFS family permease